MWNKGSTIGLQNMLQRGQIREETRSALENSTPSRGRCVRNVRMTNTNLRHASVFQIETRPFFLGEREVDNLNLPQDSLFVIWEK